jgi:hypothetical protein
MIPTLFNVLAPALAPVLAPVLLMQSAPPAGDPPFDLSQIPVTEATGPRCGIVFALVGEWQRAGDERGRAWPDMVATGGLEFFVQAMAQLMDQRSLDRPAVVQVVARDIERLKGAGDHRIAAMMPACLQIKQAAGL